MFLVRACVYVCVQIYGSQTLPALQCLDAYVALTPAQHRFATLVKTLGCLDGATSDGNGRGSGGGGGGAEDGLEPRAAADALSGLLPPLVAAVAALESLGSSGSGGGGLWAKVPGRFERGGGVGDGLNAMSKRDGVDRGTGTKAGMRGKRSLVVFLGGCSYAEVAALRFWNRGGSGGGRGSRGTRNEDEDDESEGEQRCFLIMCVSYSYAAVLWDRLEKVYYFDDQYDERG
jgi:hypothetical protein